MLPGCILLFFCVLAACESTLMREFNHHMSGNDLRSAHSVLDRELAGNPNNAEANYLKGNLLSREKQYTEANRFFDRSLSSSSVYREHIDYLRERNYRIELGEGLDAQELNRNERAVQQLRLASQIFPDRTEPLPLLGRAYEELDRTGEAADTYGECLRLESSHYECGIRLAELEAGSNNYNRVIELAGNLRAEYPEDWRPLQLLTEAYMETGRYEEAEGTLTALLSIQNSYRTLKNTALAFYNHGEIRRAEYYLRQCLSQQPNDKDVLQTLTDIYLNSRNYELVIEAAERLLRSEPENQTVRAKLMIAYELIGDLDNYKKLRDELELTRP